MRSSRPLIVAPTPPARLPRTFQIAQPAIIATPTNQPGVPGSVLSMPGTMRPR